MASRLQMKDLNNVITSTNTPHSMLSLHIMQKGPRSLGYKVPYFFFPICFLDLEVFSRVGGKIAAELQWAWLSPLSPQTTG